MNYHNISCLLSILIPFHSKINEQVLGCNQRQCDKSPQVHSGWTPYWQNNHSSQLGMESSSQGGRNNRGRHGEIKTRGGLHIKNNRCVWTRSKGRKPLGINVRLMRKDKWQADIKMGFLYMYSYSRRTWNEICSSCLATTVQWAVGLYVFFTCFLDSNWPREGRIIVCSLW